MQWPKQLGSTYYKEKNSIFLNKGNSFLITCETNDPTATVYLLRSTDDPQLRWTNALSTFNGRMKKVGQNFYIKSVEFDDEGKYKCIAHSGFMLSKISLVKGQLMVYSKKLVFRTNKWVSPGNIFENNVF